MNFSSGFHVDEEVVTRRGKRGRVVSVEPDGMTLVVRFGSREFPMRCTQVVKARSYDSAGRGYARQLYQ